MRSGFIEGNQLWRQVKDPGRDLLFSSPTLLWEAAKEYFTWCDEHPLQRKDWVGKDAMEVWRQTVRPYTLAGLSLFTGASPSWWRNFKVRDSVTGDPEFMTVIARIEAIMFEQKFSGAAVGDYKENLISRELGLKDNQDIDVTSGGDKITQIIKWGDKEINV